ncbi:hypothetical protein B0H10DRAFT_2065184 [Mycena sp. CBHHK59/15]|nr:hypothetical protein B0H10DRAFT_2065184 [Mycena sp. CBHHK59/15]
MTISIQAISDYFKPHRAEALLRVRTNVFGVLLIAVMSSLVPRIPSLPTALATVLSGTGWATDGIYGLFCILEVGTVALLLTNILQAVYAVKYPRAPLPPSPSPAKPKGIHMAPPTPQRAFRLSPNSSPQPQKSFSFAASSSALQSSTSSTYPSSPISTPSRVLHYSIPPTSSTSTLMSSSSTNLHTPSPILSAYHGKHLSGSPARPIDGAFLAGLFTGESDDE